MSLAQQGVGSVASPRIVALLALAAFINYVDRGNLATAGPLIRDQLGLSDTQLGLLLSAFFWSYTAGQLPAGWLAERIDPRRVLAAGLAIWGAATALTGLVSGFLMLLALRLVLGLGESVMYPASFKILAAEASEGQRGRANGFLASGQLATPHDAAARRSVSFAGQTPDAPSTAMILRRRELWASCLAQFCGTYSLYLVLSWLPVYLVDTHGFSMAQMAPIGAGVYTLSAATSVLTGWASDRWLSVASVSASGPRHFLPRPRRSRDPTRPGDGWESRTASGISRGSLHRSSPGSSWIVPVSSPSPSESPQRSPSFPPQG